MNDLQKVCRNCGLVGHINKHCNNPITSYGVVLINNLEQEPYYLFVQRKNTIGFIEFIFGKYNIKNKEYLNGIFKRMTYKEYEFIKLNNFKRCWKHIYNRKNYPFNLENKYNLFKKIYNLNDFIINYQETEWEFPKGRRNNNESDLECAKREFVEETNIDLDDILITNNRIEEKYISNNNNKYRHIYYIGYLKNNISLQKKPCREILRVSWMNYEEGLKKIRGYSLHKKKILKLVHSNYT